MENEFIHKCDFCLKEDEWPIVFKAGPYWTHDTCLVKSVEEGRRSPEDYQ